MLRPLVYWGDQFLPYHKVFWGDLYVPKKYWTLCEADYNLEIRIFVYFEFYHFRIHSFFVSVNFKWEGVFSAHAYERV